MMASFKEAFQSHSIILAWRGEFYKHLEPKPAQEDFFLLVFKSFKDHDYKQ